MSQAISCVTVLQAFFFVTTLLFVIISILLLNRSQVLRKKLSDMVEALAGKDKELNKAKADAQDLLSPFIPESSRSIIISMDAEGRMIDMNDYACELFGYTKEELIGKEAFGLIFPKKTKNNQPQSDIISRIFANPKLYVENETENVKKSGEHFWISWTNRVMYDDSGEPKELRSVGFDITKRKRLEEELKYLASVDPQTGVLNRQAILEAGYHELKRAVRYKRNLSVLIMQLDYFHSVDDHRDFSDDIVRQVVAITQNIIRDSDYIGRVGDVEFALILPETSQKNAMTVANRIKEKIHKENLQYKGGFFITVHFGAAEKTNDRDLFDDMLLKALISLNTPIKQPVLSRKGKSKPRKKKGL